MSVFALIKEALLSFLPTGVTHCTDWVKSGMQESTKSSPPRHGYTVGLWDPKNCKLYEIWEHKRPTEAHPLHESYEIFMFCGQFQFLKFGGIHLMGSKIKGV